MSETQFLLTRIRVLDVDAKRIDRIVKDCGGYGFVGPISLPGNDVRGWCTGPNYGDVENQALRDEVLRRLEVEGMAWLFGGQ